MWWLCHCWHHTWDLNINLSCNHNLLMRQHILHGTHYVMHIIVGWKKQYNKIICTEQHFRHHVSFWKPAPKCHVWTHLLCQHHLKAHLRLKPLVCKLLVLICNTQFIFYLLDLMCDMDRKPYIHVSPSAHESSFYLQQMFAKQFKGMSASTYP